MSCRVSSSLLFALLFGATTLSAYAEADSLRAKWRRTATDYELIQTKKPFLLIDGREGKMQLRLGAAVALEVKADSGSAPFDVKSFAADFGEDSSLLYSMSKIELMEFEPRFPDSLLAIVSKAMDMDPSLLQREIPVKFQVEWHNGPKLLLHSKPQGTPVVIEKPFRIKLGEWLDSFSEGKLYEIEIDRESALTLHRTFSQGVPTMVVRE